VVRPRHSRLRRGHPVCHLCRGQEIPRPYVVIMECRPEHIPASRRILQPRDGDSVNILSGHTFLLVIVHRRSPPATCDQDTPDTKREKMTHGLLLG